MNVFALFDDKSAEKVNFEFLQPYSTGDRVEITYLNSIPDNVKESADKGIKEAYVVLSGCFNAIPEKISIWFRGFDKSIQGNSTDIAFSTALIVNLMDKTGLLKSMDADNIFATGVLGKHGEVKSISGLKSKMLAILQLCENTSGSLVFLPEENLFELNTLLQEDSNLTLEIKKKNIKLVPVKKLKDIVETLSSIEQPVRKVNKFFALSPFILLLLLIGIVTFVALISTTAPAPIMAPIEKMWTNSEFPYSYSIGGKMNNRLALASVSNKILMVHDDDKKDGRIWYNVYNTKTRQWEVKEKCYSDLYGNKMSSAIVLTAVGKRIMMVFDTSGGQGEIRYTIYDPQTQLWMDEGKSVTASNGAKLHSAISLASFGDKVMMIHDDGGGKGCLQYSIYDSIKDQWSSEYSYTDITKGVMNHAISLAAYPDWNKILMIHDGASKNGKMWWNVFNTSTEEWGKSEKEYRGFMKESLVLTPLGKVSDNRILLMHDDPDGTIWANLYNTASETWSYSETSYSAITPGSRASQLAVTQWNGNLFLVHNHFSRKEELWFNTGSIYMPK